MDTFFHIRMVMSIIMGLSITHLLKGGTKIIEYPKKYKPYWVHLLWALYVFLLLIYFWWFEIHLREIKQWVFIEYVFVIGYIIFTMFCVLYFSPMVCLIMMVMPIIFIPVKNGFSRCWRLFTPLMY